MRMSLMGLAEYMVASPIRQRSILQRFKYAETGEGFAMRLYYQDARKAIVEFHSRRAPRASLRRVSDLLLTRAEIAEKPHSAQRLRQNARALSQYDEHFGSRRFDVLRRPRLSMVSAGVVISATPDLYVRENNALKLVKLGFSRRAPDERMLRIIAEVTNEAVAAHVPALDESVFVLFDIPRGEERDRLVVDTRTADEISAACEAIAQVWPGIEPPRRRAA